MNIGNEKQKSGINVGSLDAFFTYCTKDLKLNVIGLMAIPPNDGQESLHFKNLMELNLKQNYLIIKIHHKYYHYLI